MVRNVHHRMQSSCSVDRQWLTSTCSISSCPGRYASKQAEDDKHLNYLQVTTWNYAILVCHFGSYLVWLHLGSTCSLACHIANRKVWFGFQKPWTFTSLSPNRHQNFTVFEIFQEAPPQKGLEGFGWFRDSQLSDGRDCFRLVSVRMKRRRHRWMHGKGCAVKIGQLCTGKFTIKEFLWTNLFVSFRSM